MILSFAAIAGFVYWLSVSAEPTTVEVVEEPVEELTDGAVSMADFSLDPTAYIGQEVTLQNIPVTSLLGPHSFWTSLADANETPYLVHMGGALVADGAMANLNAMVDVVGTVMATSDSILNAWEAAGAFPGGADRIQAEFAENFLEATTITEVTPGS